MLFQTIMPPPALQSVVRYFWTLEGSSENEQQKTFRTMADGCPGIIYQHADNGTFYQQEKQLPELFLFGQTTRYAEISLAGTFNTVGIYFQPNALQCVFNENAEELTDLCVDINLLTNRHGFNLSNQLAEATSANKKVEILSAYLSSQLNRNNRKENSTMEYALNQIIQTKGNIDLGKLQSHLQLSERSFLRNFKQYTGIAPKLFSRICRFQSSLKQLRKTDYNKLSDIAYEQDYADQSHFIRSFKEFSGLSPNQYQKQTNEVVENFSEVLK
ncbi:response regulator transcription factor [Mucilaginibacter sp. OK098]|uniref:response regulator transcription factor n=1 Tax=Mucilaginibacter sp. OK098 TaxID=1855297 RepID=UPI00091627B8|nr:response regulator transcription factor [Mucilaginibacter sp. OK098]SHL92726.1 AraC-type DNA-binding protein [Mucilaginibacter sp. OK098]